MFNILSFILGALCVFYFMNQGTKNVHEVWQQAYQVGRDDGEIVARSQESNDDAFFKEWIYEVNAYNVVYESMGKLLAPMISCKA